MVAQVFKMKTKEAGEDSMEVKSVPLSRQQQEKIFRKFNEDCTYWKEITYLQNNTNM